MKSIQVLIKISVAGITVLLFTTNWVGAQKRLLTAQDLMALTPTESDHTLHYGRGESQFGQLRVPESDSPHPVVVIIHGGCWMGEYDLNHISPLASAITELGFATWSLEYRRIGNPGGGWPGTFLDIADGVDYLHELSTDFHLDLQHVLVLGHSAGGHLALWAAARLQLPPESPVYRASPLPVQGVISLAGITDLSGLEFQKGCGDSALKLMGGSREEYPIRYAHASPLDLLPFHVPQILIQGKQDRIVSFKGAELYRTRAYTEGDRCSLVLLEDSGHFELVHPGSSAWKTVKKALLDYLPIS